MVLLAASMYRHSVAFAPGRLDGNFFLHARQLRERNQADDVGLKPMSLHSASLARLLIAAFTLFPACSFDANTLRALPHKDAESPYDQAPAGGDAMGTARDVSSAPTSSMDGDGAQDIPSVGQDVQGGEDPDHAQPLGFEVRVSNDVLVLGGAGGGSDGAGGGGGGVGEDGPTDVPTDGIGAGGAKGTDGAASADAPTISGGTMSLGGRTGAGGTTGSGGRTGAGGTTSSGGTPGRGGTTGSGGTPGSGGKSSTGGITGAGGSNSSGPYCATYTDLGTLPSTSTEYTSVSAEETCFRFTVAATSEVIRGIQMSNCGMRTLTINGTASGCTPGTNCTIAVSLARATDSYWYLQFSASTGTGCTSTWWWSP